LTPAWANRLFDSGAETNNFITTEWTAIEAGSPTFSTLHPHSGTYSIRCNPSATTCGWKKNLSGSKTSGTLIFAGHPYIVTTPGVTDTIFKNANNSSTLAMEIQLTTSRTLILKNSVTTTTQTSSTALSADTHYRLEWEQVLSDTVGSLTLKIFANGGTTALETLTITGEDTLPTNVLQNYWGSLTSTTADIYWDDFIINDEAGGVFDTWTGPFKVGIAVPASDDTVLWTKNGAGCTSSTNFDCVNEVPGDPDDFTTYTSSSAASDADRLNITTLPAEIPSDADMISVTVSARICATGTGQGAGRMKLWDEGGNLTDGPSINWALGAGVCGRLSTAQTLTFNMGTRTKANAQSFDIGYAGISGTGGERDTSAQWGNFVWTEGAAGGRAIVAAGSIVGAGTIE